VSIEVEVVLRLLLAAALGAIIGFQRERANRPAGLRTHTLVLVAGLTTAATIWIVAAIGLAAGTGLYVLSAVTTVIALIVLLLPHPIR